MAAITGNLIKITEFGGEQKLVTLTALIESASDTVTLTEATHGITEITNIVGLVIRSGQDAQFTGVSASYSGLVVTVTSVEQDGTASTSWGDTTIYLTVMGK